MYFFYVFIRISYVLWPHAFKILFDAFFRRVSSSICSYIGNPNKQETSLFAGHLMQGKEQLGT